MNHLSVKMLTGEQFQRWAEARKSLYKGVLRDPKSTGRLKSVAKVKLEATKLPIR